jgi:hypothetical protein
MVIPPTLPEWIRWAFLAVAAALYLVAIVAWLWGRLKGEGGAAASGPTATTGGGGSPALAGTFRDVYIGQTPPAPSREPVVTQLSEMEADVIRARSAIHPHAALAAANMPIPRADRSFDAVLVLVYRALGGAPDDPEKKQAFYDRVDREISKRVQENRMSVWGFYGKRGPELLSMATLQKGWFDHKKRVFVSPSIDTVHPMLYEHLEFNKEQVERAWPAPEQASNATGPRRTRTPVRYDPPEEGR